MSHVEFTGRIVNFKKKFEEIKQKFLEYQNINTVMSAQLHEYEIEIKKKTECANELREEVENLRSVCSNQEKIISNVLTDNELHEKVLADNVELKKSLLEWKKRVDDIQKLNDTAVKLATENHIKEIADLKEQFQNQTEFMQASYDLRTNEMQTISKSYEISLKKARDNERELTRQVDMLNNQMSSSISVYKKKAYELEKKVQQLEKEKSSRSGSSVSVNTSGSGSGITTNSTGSGHFLTAQNILNMATNNVSVSTNIYTPSPNIKLATNQVSVSNNTSNPTANLTTSVSEANNLMKRFKFSKNKTNAFQVLVNTELEKNDKDLKIDKATTNEDTSTKTKTSLNPVKKRKLFNPNNFDYLQ